MTFLVLILGSILAKLWMTTHGTSVLYGPVTVWIALMWTTFLTAAFYAIKEGDRPELTTVAVVALVMLGRQIGWHTGHPYAVHAVAGLWGMAVLLIFLDARYQAIIALAFGFQFLVAALGAFDLIHSSAGRSFRVIALTYPDVLAIVGHGVNVCLGFNFDGSVRGGRLAKRVFAFRRPSPSPSQTVASNGESNLRKVVKD